MGLEELPLDAQYATNPARVKHRVQLLEILQAKLRERSSCEWLAVLEGSGLAYEHAPFFSLSFFFFKKKNPPNQQLEDNGAESFTPPARWRGVGGGTPPSALSSRRQASCCCMAADVRAFGVDGLRHQN